MRILIQSINFSPELTGVGKYTGEMAEWLAARGHEVRVVTAPPHYPQWRVFPGHSALRSSREQVSVKGGSGELEVFRCPVWVPRVPRGWRRILHLASFSLGSSPAMLRQIAWRPHAVFLVVPTLFCSPQALCLARVAGAVSWLHVHDFEVDAAFELGDFSSSRLRRCVQAIEHGLMRRFHRTSSISERMVERLAAKGVDSDRAILFPNWVDTSIIYPMSGPNSFRRELGISEKTIVALYAGSMGKKQGLELLMAAAKRLASRADIQFVLCGDGPDRQALARAAKESGRTLLLPLQSPDRLNELLNLADLHLLPQLADAADLMMPSKLAGMMASGRPTVATAHSGTQLAMVLGGRGLVTQPGDLDSFVQALVRLAEDHELRHSMGKRAREHAVEYMGQDKILGRFERSLLAACGQSPRGKEQFAKRQPGKAAAVGNFVIAPGQAGDD